MAERPESLSTRIGRGLREAERFLTRDLWERHPTRRRQRWLDQLLRLGVLTWDGLVRSDVFTLAAALTFKVVFSLVPFLAVMFAFFKGLGGLSGLAGPMKEFIFKHLAAPELGKEIAAKLDEFIENVNATAIGVVGFLVLLYTSLSLLDTVEKTFNRIWGIKSPRRLLRRFTVYWSILTVSPIVLAASLAMTAFVRSHRLYVWLTEKLPFLGPLSLGLTPFVFAWALFTLLYIVVPNTRVRFGAALAGALVAGTSWEVMKNLYVWYNTQVVATERFYGSLGAVPVFLLWIYLSWIVVLLGAEIAFAIQHVDTYRRELEGVRLSAADRDRLALVIAVDVVRPFATGQPPPTAEEIAARLGAPSRVVHEIAYQLVARGVLLETTAAGAKDPGLLPARDPASITAHDVLQAVRRYGDPLAMPADENAAAVCRLVDQAEELAVTALARVSLRDLATGAKPPQVGPAHDGPELATASSE